MRNKSVFGIATLIFSLPALVGAGPLAPTPAAAVENCAALALVNGSFEAPLPSPPANIGYWWGDFSTLHKPKTKTVTRPCRESAG